MILTTTPTIDNYHISQYLDIVSGADTYTVGGIIGEGFLRQGSYYEMALDKAKSQMESKASLYGADAIVGIQVAVTSMATVGEIVVTATGTAVKIEKAGWDEEIPEL